MTQQTQVQSQLSTSSIGRHSELLAMAALIADGWSVSEPTVPEAHDLEAKKYVGNEKITLDIQVKTIKKRVRDGVDYYVIRGLKNNGSVYGQSDCDAFIGIVDGEVYMTPNRCLTEYWVRVDEADGKWRKLPLTISEKGAIN